MSFRKLTLGTFAVAVLAMLAWGWRTSLPQDPPHAAPAVQPAHTAAPAASTAEPAATDDALPVPLPVAQRSAGAPAFVADGEDFRLQNDTFLARVNAADGVRVQKPGTDCVLGLRLDKIHRGEEIHYDRYADQHLDEVAGRINRHGHLAFARNANLTERYVALPDGVEAFFDLAEKPAGDGDLYIYQELDLQNLRHRYKNTFEHDLMFVDEQDRIVMAIGEVVAYDAQGNTVRARPEFWRTGRHIRFALPEDWLENAAYPVQIDPAIVVNGSDIIFTDGSFLPEPPNVGASAAGFLITFTDVFFGNANPVLIGDIVDTSGGDTDPFEMTLLEEGEIPLATLSKRQSSDGNNLTGGDERFLAVYADARGGIWGIVVEPDEDPVLTAPFLIAATTTKLANEAPLVAYNGDRFLVAWHDRIGKSGVGIFFTHVDIDGGTPTFDGVAQAGFVPTIPTDQFLFLAAPGPDNTTLLVYRENSLGPLQSMVQRIDGDGNILDPEGRSLFKDLPADFGFGAPIGAAMNAAGDGWDILSTNDQRSSSVVYRHTFSEDGIAVRADEVPGQEATGGRFAYFGVAPIGLTVEDAFASVFPVQDTDLPGGGTDNMWLFLRNFKETNGTLRQIGKRVDFSGNDYDATPFFVDDGAGVTRRAATAAATKSAATSKRYLVAWLEGGNVNATVGNAIGGAIIDTDGDAENANFLEAVLDNDIDPGERTIAIPIGGTVEFDWSQSISDDMTLLGGGVVTKQEFFPGLGSGKNVAIDTFTFTFTYTKAGTYTALVRLYLDNYTVHDTIKVVVGGGLGTEGVDAVVGPDSGFLGNSADINTAMTITAVRYDLIFAGIGDQDALLVDGFIRKDQLPETATGESITGKGVEITIFGPGLDLADQVDTFDEDAPAGPKVFQFNVDGNGFFRSPLDTDSDNTRFFLNPSDAFFRFEVVSADLIDHLIKDSAPFSVSPARDRRFRIGIKIFDADFNTEISDLGEVTVVVRYSAGTSSGDGDYFLNGKGEEETGMLEITKSGLKEGKLKKPTIGYNNSLTVKGKLIVPRVDPFEDGDLISLPATGTWQFFAGDFASAVIDIPTAIANKQLKQSKSTISYKAAKGETGTVKNFKLNRKTGIFNIKYHKVEQEPGLMGMAAPLARTKKGDEDPEVEIDFFIGFDLDLSTQDAEDFTTRIGTMRRLKRATSRTTSWK